MNLPAPPEWQLSAYDFHLPEHLIAQHPATQRDQARMLRLPLRDNEISHHRFSEIVELLPDDVCLVLNNTKVVPARLLGKRATGATLEALLLEERAPGCWNAMLRKAGRVKPEEWLLFGETLHAQALERREDGTWDVQFAEPETLPQRLEAEGLPPLPPYIRRKDLEAETLVKDKQRYQTVYAREAGAVAAPTAGLHFTPETLTALRQRDLPIVEVTLHVGRGTFLPVQTDDVREHRMHQESFRVAPEAWQQLQQLKSEGRRILAVGTTVVRVLETIAQQVEPQLSGQTEIFIYPPYSFQMVDALLTNFHLPQSTLLMLVSALCGRERLLKAYAEAVQREYRFFSYGDCMLIL
jgi:S-adenosylmethionine:tRNA ribosyltransferase-isomerase